jgi:hypothetical protein
MEKNVNVYAERKILIRQNIHSKILALAFSLSVVIERNLITQRTTETHVREKTKELPEGKYSFQQLPA